MAISLQEIAKYLEAEEFKFQLDTEKEVIFTGISDGKEAAALFFRMKEDGEMFSMDMEPMADNKSDKFDAPMDSPHLFLLLQQMLFANFQTKFGSWEYDPRDGDIKFTIEFPVEDGTITLKQFKRILSGANSALDAQARFKKILATGEVPAQESQEDQAVALLEAMLAQAKARANKSGGDGDGI